MSYQMGFSQAFEFLREMRRHLNSGNDVPVTSVLLKAEDLDQLLSIAEDYMDRYENWTRED